MPFKPTLSLLSLAMLAGAMASLAWTLPATASEHRNLWVFEYENDTFAGNDRFYTSGVRFSRIRGDGAPPNWKDRFTERVFGWDEDDSKVFRFSLSHQMFTPDNIEDPLLPPDDRPYAGWLNLEFSTGRQLENGAERIRLGLGITGPAALGRQVQRAVHSVIGADRPRRWGTQLRNEPTLLLGYDRFWRTLQFGDADRFGMDLTLVGGGAAGNAYTYAGGGGFLRFGHNLPEDYGPPRIVPAAAGSGFFPRREARGWYMFAGWEGRRMYRDLFLEGNTIGGRDGVRKRRYLGELYGGVVYTRGSVRLAYTHIWRNREFIGQTAGLEYGNFSFSFWW